MWTHFGSNNLVEQSGGFYQLVGERHYKIHHFSPSSEHYDYVDLASADVHLDEYPRDIESIVRRFTYEYEYQLASHLIFHARIGSRRTIHRTSVASELKLLKLL
jgi:hypothetical protein